MSRFFQLLFLSLALQARPALGAIEYVLAISVDGMRGDFLQTFVETAPAEFPNFTKLRDRSAFTFNARSDYSQTITIPDHLSMLTGRPVSPVGGLDVSLTHGYVGNVPGPNETVHVYDSANGFNSGPYKASIFDSVHDRGLSTALYLGKDRLQICERSWNAANGGPDLIGEDNGRNKLDYSSVVEAMNTDGATTTGFINDLAFKIAAGTLKNFTFLHFAEVDYAGHGSAWSTTEGGAYRNAVDRVDAWLGQILDAIDGNAALKGRIALIVTADHGGGTPSNGHDGLVPYNLPTNYTIPFFLIAPGITPGTDLYDWFENRSNPGLLQVNDLAPDQPIRNGDVANLAATLIGVPYVEGSWRKAELKKPVRVNRLDEGRYSVNWPVYLTGWKLEACDDLAAVPQVWTVVTSGITDEDGVRTHLVTVPAPNARFFRLRSP